MSESEIKAVKLKEIGDKDVEQELQRAKDKVRELHQEISKKALLCSAVNPLDQVACIADLNKLSHDLLIASYNVTILEVYTQSKAFMSKVKY